MPPAKKRRVAAAKAAAESVDAVTADADIDIAMKDDDDDGAPAPPPPPTSTSTSTVTVVDDAATTQTQPSAIQSQPNNHHAHAVVVSDDHHQHGILTTKLFDMHRATLQSLRDNIAELAIMTSTTPTASSTGNDTNGINNDHHPDPLLYNELLLTSSLALSDLKSIQRRLSLQVEQHANISKERRERVEHISLLLENLIYERNYLQREIMALSSWKPEELEKMAWSELGMSPSAAGGGGGGSGGSNGVEGMDIDEHQLSSDKSKITTAEEAIDAYLFGNASSDSTGLPPSSSHRDPTHHPFILQKIQSDLEARASLVEQLTKSKLELRELQKKRDNLRGFLNQIPKKVLELEKAGESLNAFFGNSNVWKDALVSNDGNDNDIGDDTDETMMDVVVTDSDTKKSNDKKQVVQAANLLVHRASSDRTTRFHMAQSNLPSPLYVLFVQLTGYIDAWATMDKLGGVKSNNILDGFVGANGMKLTVVPNEKEGSESSSNGKWNVVLTLSSADIIPPEVSSILGKSYSSSRSASSTGIIQIIFSFNADLGVVLASVEGDGESNADKLLLDNLFPGDDGLTNPNAALSLLTEEEELEDDIDNQDDSISTGKENQGNDAIDSYTRFGKSGKPYYWCQVLSGLNFPPPLSAANSNDMTDAGEKASDTPFQIQTCTKAVFRQLTRRIRARKTLASILEYLGKRSSLHPLPIPIHPALKGEDSTALQSQSTKGKLHSWTEDSKHRNPAVVGATQKCYTAIIKRKSSTLKATVIIDTQNYPIEPPVWSLQNEDGSIGMSSTWAEDHGSVSSLQHGSNSNTTASSPPLFDAALNRIECHVNQDLDKFVNPTVESTFDWILIHQLADIMSCWDEVMIACEGSAGGGNNASKTGGEMGILTGQERVRKGKDRRLVGFGERSPFFWYRKGI